jgi:hypothetical protein
MTYDGHQLTRGECAFLLINRGVWAACVMVPVWWIFG